MSLWVCKDLPALILTHWLLKDGTHKRSTDLTCTHIHTMRIYHAIWTSILLVSPDHPVWIWSKAIPWEHVVCFIQHEHLCATAHSGNATKTCMSFTNYVTHVCSAILLTANVFEQGNLCRLFIYSCGLWACMPENAMLLWNQISITQSSHSNRSTHTWNGYSQWCKFCFGYNNLAMMHGWICACFKYPIGMINTTYRQW